MVSISLSTVIYVLLVSIRTGQLEELNLVPVLRNSKLLRTDHFLVGRYRAKGCLSYNYIGIHTGTAVLVADVTTVLQLY